MSIRWFEVNIRRLKRRIAISVAVLATTGPLIWAMLDPTEPGTVWTLVFGTATMAFIVAVGALVSAFLQFVWLRGERRKLQE